MTVKKKKNKIFIILKRSIKLRHLFILSFLFIFNSFAWFIYSTEVSNGLTAHVRSWKVLFANQEGEMVDYIDINIDSIYPGMIDFLEEIKAYNQSEVIAKMSYEIMEATILDQYYLTVEGALDKKEDPTGITLTSALLLEQLEKDYPFKIKVSVSNEQISPSDGEATYQIRVTWPYESGDDAQDTLWGEKAYDFHSKLPDEPSIKLRIKITATQEN